MSWNKESFISLLLIYASNVDMSMTEDEHQWIARNLGEEAYQQAKAFYDEKSEYEVLQQVISLKDDFLIGEDAMATCQNYLTGLFEADGDFSRFEHDVLHVLNKLLK